MCIRPLCSSSPAQYLSTEALTGETFRSIALRFSECSSTATQTRQRCGSGRGMNDRLGFKIRKVLRRVRAVRGRGIADFESFSELTGLLLGSAQ